MFEKMFIGEFLKKAPKIISWIYTFFVTVIGWTLFMWDTNSLYYMLARILRLFSQSKDALPFTFTVSMLGLEANIIYLLLGIIIATPIGKLLGDGINRLMKPTLANRQSIGIVHDICFVVLFLVCIIFLVGETFNPFIYFRF